MDLARSSHDPFDRLPDAILLNIFNKLHDIKALGRCAAVSQRFNCIILQVEEVVLKVDRLMWTKESGKSHPASFVEAPGSRFFRPLRVLPHLLSAKKRILPQVSHRSPGEVLKNFKGVRHLKIELPNGEQIVDKGLVLKWRAEFGTTLENCVILAASSLIKGVEGEDGSNKCIESPIGGGEDTVIVHEGSGIIPGPEQPVMWTTGTLIDASARHYLLQQIVQDHPTLETLTFADADGVGTLCMSKHQLVDFRDMPIEASASSNRTQLPDLDIRLWYAPFLDLPGGLAMEGATLVAIRPSDHKDSEVLLMNAFEEPYNIAASSLARGRPLYSGNELFQMAGL